MSVKNIIHSCHFKNTAVSVFPSNRNDRQHNSIMTTAVNATLFFTECVFCNSLRFCCLIILLDIFFPRFFFSAYNMHDFEKNCFFARKFCIKSQSTLSHHSFSCHQFLFVFLFLFLPVPVYFLVF